MSLLIHEKTNQAIADQLIQNEGSYLWVGPQSIGKATAAAHFLKKAYANESDYQSHVFWLQPDGASIGVEQVHGLREQLVLKSASGQRRFVVIDSIDDVTIEAQNMLLKQLEEPPVKLMWILLATNESAALPTIRSRCQAVHFQRLAVSEMESFVKSSTTIEVEGIGQQDLITASNGRPGVAHRYIHDALYREELVQSRQLIAAMDDGSVLERLRVTKLLCKAHKGKDERSMATRFAEVVGAKLAADAQTETARVRLKHRVALLQEYIVGLQGNAQVQLQIERLVVQW